jgi:hypothetical protein
MRIGPNTANDRSRFSKKGLRSGWLELAVATNVNKLVASGAQRDQVFGCVVTKAAPRPNVMNL